MTNTKVHTPTTVVIKGKLPGEAVDRHLKRYGHLPNTKLCDDKGSCLKPKLDKAQEKRFDEWRKSFRCDCGGENNCCFVHKSKGQDLKQHLADELAREREKIMKMNIHCSELLIGSKRKKNKHD